MEPNNNDWQPCPKGEFGRLEKRLIRRRHRRALLQVAGYMGAAAVLISSGMLLYPVQKEDPEQPIVAIGCGKVCENAIAFGKGTVPDDLRQQILHHLDHCQKCHIKYQQLGLVS